MNKKEVSEVKKQLSPANCAISKICGCYVDDAKNKKSEFCESFLSLPEEETFKYFEIFRKGLSGKLEQNLLNVSIPSTAEDHRKQDFLFNLVKSGLQSPALLEQFYDMVINSYDYVGNYLILLIHSTYDVPGKTTDNMKNYDGSDSVYRHIQCCICPVNLSKPGLSYNETNKQIQNRVRDWVVDKPVHGFLFPAFNDRCADIHSLLFYTQKNADSQNAFVEQLTGNKVPFSSETQKEAFETLCETVIGNSMTYETAIKINDSICEYIEEKKDQTQPLKMDKEIVKDIFEASDIGTEKLSAFDEAYEEIVGSDALFAENIINSKHIKVEGNYFHIQMESDFARAAKVQYINGVRCLVIELDGSITVNGVCVNSCE